MYKIRRNDIYLGICLAMATVLLAVAFFAFQSSAAGDTVSVTLDGALYGEYPLNEDLVLNLETDRGHNIIEIRDGRVSMTDADCPDRYCVSTGEISRTGQSIVCLPHRLVISIHSDETSAAEYDLIAQ